MLIILVLFPFLASLMQIKVCLSCYVDEKYFFLQTKGEDQGQDVNHVVFSSLFLIR